MKSFLLLLVVLMFVIGGCASSKKPSRGYNKKVRTHKGLLYPKQKKRIMHQIKFKPTGHEVHSNHTRKICIQ